MAEKMYNFGFVFVTKKGGNQEYQEKFSWLANKIRFLVHNSPQTKTKQSLKAALA